MASRQSGHNTKNRLEKEQYVKYIKTQDYEPTKEEGLNFKDSSDKDEDFSIGKTEKPRRLSIVEQIKEHFQSKWIEWLIGGLSVVLIFFTFSAKFQLNTHEIKIDQNKTDIDAVNSKVENIEKQNTNQDLQIQENKIRLEYIDKPKNDTTKNGR